MTDAFWLSVVGTTIAATVTTIGISAVARYESWARRNSIYFASFAAGVLITVAFLQIAPLSISLSASAPQMMLAGYLGLFPFNRFLTAFVCDKNDDKYYPLGLVPLVGIGIHSFVDGMIYAVSFNVDLKAGALVSFGMILHEFPEGIITYTLMLRSGFSSRSAFLLALLAAALTTPMGAIASYPIINEASTEISGSLLGLSGGALIYVGATHLLPQALQETRPFATVTVVAGIILALFMILGHQ